jgi:PPK2 family polyphosphate:nucleotide phosphotransferase
MIFREQFRVKPRHRVQLGSLDPADTGGYKHDAAMAEAERHHRRLTELQSVLYAEARRSVLIVLQAPDAGGKDGTVTHVFSAFNPQGVRAVSFKQPTRAELAHDFLWRIHPHTPGRGEIAIYNRSHYEDVLVTRVHKMVDRDTWTARYKTIREFEASLTAGGTTILKFFLHISKAEQLARFATRLEDPEHNWKISDSDYTERELWDDYVLAFEDAIGATSTDEAPWFIIPSNHKWFRNLAISAIVSETMGALDLRYPAPSVDLAAIRRKYHAAVKAAN